MFVLLGSSSRWGKFALKFKACVFDPIFSLEYRLTAYELSDDQRGGPSYIWGVMPFYNALLLYEWLTKI